MNQFGISIYPTKETVDETIEYIELAAKHDFKRIFTCLISLEGSVEESIDHYKKIIAVANDHGMEVIADVTPNVFKKLGLNYRELGFFHDLGLAGLRLDLGFSGIEEALMTTNPYGLKIEINISNGTKYLENILSYQPKKSNLYGCHNFYPHEYTGLSREHFMKCSQQFIDNNIRTAAFVNSKQATFGPWPTKEGLCTLEEHRNLPLEVQVKDLIHNGKIDDIIVANAFASEDELKMINNINVNMLELSVDLNKTITPVEKKIVLEELHFNRGDVSEYVIRSTQSRVKYKEHQFVKTHTPDIKKGDILIDNEGYTRYAGELQIALKNRPNNGKTNVVGRIVEEELYLLDNIKPWQKFMFKLR